MVANNTEDSRAPQLSTETPAGSYVQPQYVERTMKFYALPESELHTISLMNTLSLVFFSLGSALISLALGIWVDSAFQTEMTPEASVLSGFGAYVLLAIGIISYIVGMWTLRRRRSLLNTIRDESRVIPR